MVYYLRYKIEHLRGKAKKTSMCTKGMSSDEKTAVLKRLGNIRQTVCFLFPADVNCPNLNTTYNYLRGASNGTKFICPNNIRVKCNLGYWIPKQKSTLACDVYGKWNPSPLPCKEILCHVPNSTSREGGRFSVLDGQEEMYAIQRQCEIRYHFTHNERVLDHECVLKPSGVGVWSPPIKQCVRISCGNLSNPDHGWITSSPGVFGSTASYECDEGYNLSLNATRECISNGQWSGKPPICKGTSSSNKPSQICLLVC